MNIDKLIEKEPSLEFVIPVLKWLKNPASVSHNELEKNRDAAYDAYTAASDVDSFDKISLTREEVEAELFKGGKQ